MGSRVPASAWDRVSGTKRKAASAITAPKTASAQNTEGHANTASRPEPMMGDSPKAVPMVGCAGRKMSTAVAVTAASPPSVTTKATPSARFELNATDGGSFWGA